MTAPASVWGVLPAKNFDAAKSRLAPVLSAADRRAFARRTFEHVLGVLQASPCLSGVLVVTDSDEVIAAAEGAGAISLRDPPGANTLADCVDHALGEVVLRGAAAAVVLLSDLPTVTTRDVGDLVAALDGADVVVAPDTGGEHTNALALRLGRRFRTAFGSGQSFREHQTAAATAFFTTSTLDTPTLRFDVDTPEDYARLAGGR